MIVLTPRAVLALLMLSMAEVGHGEGTASSVVAGSLTKVRVSDEGKSSVRGAAAEELVVWGVNYDHDAEASG